MNQSLVSDEMDRSKILFFFSIIFLCSQHAYVFRVKRGLVFNKGSRIFVRINMREDITSVFMHGVGYKMSWDLPESIRKGRKFQRRDLYAGIETLLNESELDGEICMKRFFYEAKWIIQKTDFMSRFLKFIFIPGERDMMYDSNYNYTNGGRELGKCPLSLLSFLNLN